MLISEHLDAKGSGLDEDEVEIIKGALQLNGKRVESIMTSIRQVYRLAWDEVIDSHKINNIKSRGWNRIPVLNKQRTTCYGILHVKNLLDIDFNGGVRVHDLPFYPTEIVGSMTALDTLFRRFITDGAHLIPIGRMTTLLVLLPSKISWKKSPATKSRMRQTSGGKKRAPVKRARDRHPSRQAWG